MSRPVNTRPAAVGVIGAGHILDQYIKGLRQLPELALVRLADLDPSLARARAKEFGVPAAGRCRICWPTTRLMSS